MRYLRAGVPEESSGPRLNYAEKAADVQITIQLRGFRFAQRAEARLFR